MCIRDRNETSKRYMHHYNFPSYSVGETKPSRGPGRREIGHGALAERALLPVLPSDCLLYTSKQYVGNRYVWGGTSLTNGADCSGFTLAVYRNYGISLPHSSRAQANCGTKISVSEVQPGDLIDVYKRQGYAGSRGVHSHAYARRELHGYRHSGGSCR